MTYIMLRDVPIHVLGDSIRMFVQLQSGTLTSMHGAPAVCTLRIESRPKGPKRLLLASQQASASQVTFQQLHFRCLWLTHRVSEVARRQPLVLAFGPFVSTICTLQSLEQQCEHPQGQA